MNTLLYITVLISAMAMVINATPADRSRSIAEILKEYQLATSKKATVEDVEDDSDDDDDDGDGDITNLIMNVMAASMIQSNDDGSLVASMMDDDGGYNAEEQGWFKKVIKKAKRFLKKHPVGKCVSGFVKKRFCSSQ